MAEGAERGSHVHRGRYLRGGFRISIGGGGPNRVLTRLGVNDLREHLEKKREEREYYEGASLPVDTDDDNNIPEKELPREKYDHRRNANEQQYQQNHHHKPFNTGKASNSKNFEAPIHPQNSNKPEAPNFSKDIKNPVNIKIEFSPTTGEHSYSLDEETLLPTIKHVPDRKSSYNRGFRGRGSFRGRGRGRGYPNRHFYKVSNENQGISTRNEQESEENWDLDEATAKGNENDAVKHEISQKRGKAKLVYDNDNKLKEENQNRASSDAVTEDIAQKVAAIDLSDKNE